MTDQWPNGSGTVIPRSLARAALGAIVTVTGAALAVSAWAIITMYDVGVFVGEARTTMGTNKTNIEGMQHDIADNGKAIAKMEGRHEED